MNHPDLHMNPLVPVGSSPVPAETAGTTQPCERERYDRLTLGPLPPQGFHRSDIRRSRIRLPRLRKLLLFNPAWA